MLLPDTRDQRWAGDRTVFVRSLQHVLELLFGQMSRFRLLAYDNWCSPSSIMSSSVAELLHLRTGTDYESFLYGLLTYRVLPRRIIDASEEDNTPFMKNQYSLYGDYGFGHFLMCFDSVDGFTQKCKEAKCHMDPGVKGTPGFSRPRSLVNNIGLW